MDIVAGVLAFIVMAFVPAAVGVGLFVLDRKGVIKSRKLKRAARVVMGLMAATVALMLVAVVAPASETDGTATTAEPNAPPQQEEVAEPADDQVEEPAADPVEEAVEVQAAPEPAPAPTASGTLRAHFIDVGQGDSSFFELPDGRTMLVDAGESDAGSAVVSYIKKLGYSRIDILVATHPHSDHIGGIPAVMRAFEVGEVWAPKVTHTTATFEKFLTAVADEGLSIQVATAGKVMAEDAGTGYRIDVLSPSSSTNADDLNDWSIIQEVTFGSTSFLLTGDASTRLIAAAGTGHVDVLKVGHHGSETSTASALVSSLTPTYAVISCGAGNDYGHPDQVVLNALAASTIFRTDLNGSVVVTSDGASVSASPAREADPAALMVGGDVASSAGASSSGAADGSTVVYVTKSGSKYHVDGCRHLQKSKIETTLAQAKADGYGPCGTCNPPE